MHPSGLDRSKRRFFHTQQSDLIGSNPSPQSHTPTPSSRSLYQISLTPAPQPPNSQDMVLPFPFGSSSQQAKAKASPRCPVWRYSDLAGSRKGIYRVAVQRGWALSSLTCTILVPSPTHSTRSHGFPSTRCLSRFVSPTCSEHSITFLYCCAMSAACTDIQRSEHAHLDLAGLEAGIYISLWGGGGGLFMCVCSLRQRDHSTIHTAPESIALSLI